MQHVLQALAERLNATFSSPRAGSPRRAAAVDRGLFAPKPTNTLLRAAWKLGVAQSIDELEAVQSLPLPIQVALRAMLWENLGRSRPAAVHWIWTPGPAHEVSVHPAGVEGAERCSVTVILRSPIQL